MDDLSRFADGDGLSGSVRRSVIDGIWCCLCLFSKRGACAWWISATVFCPPFPRIWWASQPLGMAICGWLIG